MSSQEPQYYDDLDIKIHLGHLCVNVLYIRFETPRPDWNVSNHFHSSFELHFIPSGSGTLHTAKGSYKVSEGTFYMTGPGVYHEQNTDKSNPMAEYAISFELTAEKRCKKLETTHMHGDEAAIIEAFSNTGLWIGLDEYSNVSLFDKIFWELENKQVGYYYNVQGLVMQIIVNASRCFMIHRKSEATAPVKLSDDKRRYILDFYFGECYKTLTFDALAANLNVSRRHLNRIIKDYYGMTFKEKLLEIRLQNSLHLLLNTDLSIEKVSENTGFASVGNFYRSFKETHGVTPGEYRSCPK